MEKIIWTEQAREDLKSIYDYIYRDSPKYADITIDNIIEITENLEVFPNSGRIVPELNDKDIREIIYGMYRIIYLIKPDNVHLITIFHTARNFNIDNLKKTII